MERRRLTDRQHVVGRIAIEPAERRLLKRIWIDPERCGGRPCIRGHRIPVELLLDFLSSGVSPTELCGPNFYPSITLDDVWAAIVFANRLVKGAKRLPIPS